MRSFVSRFQPTKSDPLFWVKKPFSWRSNRNHGIFRLTFAQVEKSVQISLFLSNKKPQVNGVHKNQPPLHIPTKRLFYHLHPERSTKPQLAVICTAPVRLCPAICTVPVLFWLAISDPLPLPRSKFLNFPRKRNMK